MIMTVEVRSNGGDEIYFVGKPVAVNRDDLETAYDAIDKIKKVTGCKKVAIYVTW